VGATFRGAKLVKLDEVLHLKIRYLLGLCQQTNASY
jgi:hypothetical protein